MTRIAILLTATALAFPLPAAAGDSGSVFRAAADADGVQRVEIVGGSYHFRPDHIVVEVNHPVELKVKKERGLTPHNIVLKAPEAGIDFEVPLGEEATTIRFTPTKTGVFKFYCNKRLLFFKSHRDRGMEGELEVVE